MFKNIPCKKPYNISHFKQTSKFDNTYIMDKQTWHQCENTFFEYRNFVIHLVSFKGVKPCECSQCDKAFVKNYRLKRHMMMHTGEKLYHYTLCVKALSQDEALKILDKRYNSEKPYKCNQFNKACSGSDEH